MLPPNTVPITAEELKQLCSIDNFTLVYVKYPENEWEAYFNVNMLLRDFGSHEQFAIKAHDYRHYFGEVVDLATKLVDGYVYFLGWRFQIVTNPTACSLHRTANGAYNYVCSGTKEYCKQECCNFYTDLFKKDLPNYNLKFIFS
jgi:hypothetical protein